MDNVQNALKDVQTSNVDPSSSRIVMQDYSELATTHELRAALSQLAMELRRADTDNHQLLDAAEMLEREVQTLTEEKRQLEQDKANLMREVQQLRRAETAAPVVPLAPATTTASRSSASAHEKTRQRPATAGPSPVRHTVSSANKDKQVVAHATALMFQQQLDSRRSGPPTVSVNRTLTLRQLREFIEEIYVSKAKFDQKCAEAHLPRETMEQHMYTYLNQKYGLKSLIVEWASALIQAIRKHASTDNDTAVFGKILRNEIDEEFRFVQNQLKRTVSELLRVYLKGKYPLKPDDEISALLKRRMSSSVSEEEWVDIVKYMYNQQDAIAIIMTVKELKRHGSDRIDAGDGENAPVVTRGISRDELAAAVAADKDRNRIKYVDFLKILLDFQLRGHERFLQRFLRLFRLVDKDNNGIINEAEFRELLAAMGSDTTEQNVAKLLSIVDPWNNQQITYSECVTFLSSDLAMFSGNVETAKPEMEMQPSDSLENDGTNDLVLE
eukprot:GILK01004929.1.p1 GENE.GILK01004929.1~~GILK01004929.1.p1  ORF type:complete len:534 (+),score=90.15 GILK01004929.1:109-1602(+)